MIKNDFSDLQPPQSKLNGIFRGVVEENNDSLKAGRCRVRVFGVHTAVKEQNNTTGIPTAELPWAEPALSIIEGAISNYGVWGVPLQGSHVFVFFENGNILNPRFFASAPGIPTTAPDTKIGFNDPDGEYPDKTGAPDFYKGEGSTYPECVSLYTHGGHRIEIDNTPGHKRILIYHNTGTKYDIDNAGNIDINCVKNETDAITGNKTETIGGNKTETITKDKSEDITGNKTETIKGTLNITVTGNATIIAPAVDIKSSATTLSSAIGSLKKLMNESLIALYNGHTHTANGEFAETDAPTQQASASNATTNTSAS